MRPPKRREQTAVTDRRYSAAPLGTVHANLFDFALIAVIR